MIQPPTINLERVSNGSKDHPRISPAIGCYMFLEEKLANFEK
jgi:hypothetical protein